MWLHNQSDELWQIVIRHGQRSRGHDGWKAVLRRRFRSHHADAQRVNGLPGHQYVNAVARPRGASQIRVE